MSTLTRILLVLHFIGLAMGFANTIANLVMAGLIGRSAPQERPVLARFPPLMLRIGEIGIALLWITGGLLVWVKWGGLAAMPWPFHVKLGAVVVLTLALARIHVLAGRARGGDTGAAARVPPLGRLAGAMAVLAVVFAVLAFD